MARCKRIKTKDIGIYYRFSERRPLCRDGKPDKCYDITYTDHGKVIFEKVGWRSEGYTKELAIEIRNLRIKKIRHPELFDSQPQNETTLNDVWNIFEEKWLPNLKRGADIKSVFLTHIQPHLGQKRLVTLTSLDIEGFRQELMQTKSSKADRNLQPGTVRKIMSDLRMIINKAHEWNLLKAGEETPKISVVHAEESRKRFLTPDEAVRLLDGLQLVACPYYYMAKIALYTGMRLGEILNLRGVDINLKAGIIHADGKRGQRTAYIPDELKSDLQKICPQDLNSFLFPSTKTKVRRKTTAVSGRFSSLVNDMGFNNGLAEESQSRVVFHTLRHTFCSWLAIKGIPLFTIGELVGHKSVQMTQRYAKLSPDAKRDAIKLIDETLKAKNNG